MEIKSSFSTNIYVNNWNYDFGTNVKLSNKIISTRYTWYTFVPVVLFEQFQIMSSFYFLLLTCINGLIDSPIPFGVELSSVILLAIIGLITRGYEEIKLYNSDKEINEQKTLILIEHDFMESKSQSIKVGDIVKCQNNDSFPADLLLLFSSRETNDCSVTTANLDGESSLKTFYGVIDPIKENELHEELKHSQLKINCIDSCEDLYKYQGMLLEKENSQQTKIMLTEKNLLLRGSKLKNTEYIVGCAVYVGQNTKLSLNSKIKKRKISSVDSRMYAYIIVHLVLQIVLALISCLVGVTIFFNRQWFINNWYVPQVDIGIWKQVELFFGFFILFNRIIPISMVYTIYTLKAIKGLFFNWDLRMYDEDLDQRARVNTFELIEELGQIEYLFSDKTGTLTENNMKFHSCFTGDVTYVDVNDVLHCVGNDGEVVQLDKSLNKSLVELFICLCLCHTVKVSNADGLPNLDFTNETLTSDLFYQASSPDEQAFLNALRNYGITYLGSKRNFHYILCFDKVECFMMRNVLEFDSTRKCMSVIVDYPDGTTQLICKGAESSLFPKAINTTVISSYMECLAKFSEKGLRVLVIGKRILTQEETEKMCNDLSHYRSTPGLIEREAELYPLIENKLTLIGVTGVEDQLQDGVYETINDLKEAGIKVWVITGDKEETAVNISLAAGHFNKDMFIHRLTNIKSEEECLKRLKSLSTFMKLEQNLQCGLVVDGESFPLLVDPLMVQEFLEICSMSQATLCCRMTPLQKSTIVQVVKRSIKPTPITAAIGDGGNDVSMILEAHVGIGIFGKEGRQAVRMADYAIGKFKFLRPAILIHGQNFYLCLTYYIFLYYFKSVLYVIPLFIYAFFNCYSALNIFERVLISLYNTTYTTIPLFAYAIFDKNLHDEDCLSKPYLYKIISKNKEMSISYFLKSFFLSIFQSFLIFAVIYLLYMYKFDHPGRNGHVYDYFTFGLLIYLSICVLIVVKVTLISKNINTPVCILFVLNIILGFLCPMIFELFPYYEEHHLIINTLSEPFSWLVIFITVKINIIIDILCQLYKNYLYQ